LRGQRAQAAPDKGTAPAITVSHTMTVRQLAHELRLSVEELEDKLAGLDETPASHEDMCACLDDRQLYEQLAEALSDAC
jgi:hypothetical protein